LQQAVRSTAQLERAAGLQALALEPNARSGDGTFDEWRALDLVDNPAGGSKDVLARRPRDIS